MQGTPRECWHISGLHSDIPRDSTRGRDDQQCALFFDIFLHDEPDFGLNLLHTFHTHQRFLRCSSYVDSKFNTGCYRKCEIKNRKLAGPSLFWHMQEQPPPPPHLPPHALGSVSQFQGHSCSRACGELAPHCALPSLPSPSTHSASERP